MPHATSLRELSISARKTADKLEFLESAMRAEGCALALVRHREAQGERAAITDLCGAAGTLRAYAALLEAQDRVIQRRTKRE